MTQDEAISLYESGFWKSMSHRDRAMFQMFERRLCMPFSVFHEAIEKTLGRPVFTHEFGLNREGLQKELMCEAPAPTMEEIMNLIPAEKRLIVAVSGSES
ncbi:hypothetical protein [Paraburkholderia tropica]|uniref:DUF7736 domain-containing protein n=1 Tax=Paraburkholderia tropica TaxID=92647 RepID=UPI0007EC8819|nr:hypothetical protein [Paraburkholderia tropica]OBR54135.1 hypothetical protein A6456_37710 [Paraburkholderia tropica]